MKEEYNPEVLESEEDTSPDVETHEEWALRKKREAMVVSRFQGKAALHQSGLLEQVQSYIARSDDIMLKIAWDEALFKRNSTMINSVGSALGLTEEQKDDLFRLASTISD